MKKQIDISNELHIYKYRSGVKLVKPDNKSHHLGKNTGYTMADLFNLPFNIGMCSVDNQIQYVNLQAMMSMSSELEKSLLGKSNKTIYTPEVTALISRNREKVLTKKTFQITEENLILNKKDITNQRLSIRFPWYNEQNNVIGLMNTSITFGQHSLSDALTHIAKMSLLEIPPPRQKLFIPHTHLTTREKQIAYHVMRGKTAKLISEILFISKRTVDVHIEHIKNKFGLYTKSDLIEKLFDYFTDDISQ